MLYLYQSKVIRKLQQLAKNLPVGPSIMSESEHIRNLVEKHNILPGLLLRQLRLRSRVLTVIKFKN